MSFCRLPFLRQRPRLRLRHVRTRSLEFGPAEKENEALYRSHCSAFPCSCDALSVQGLSCSCVAAAAHAVTASLWSSSLFLTLEACSATFLSCSTAGQFFGLMNAAPAPAPSASPSPGVVPAPEPVENVVAPGPAAIETPPPLGQEVVVLGVRSLSDQVTESTTQRE